MAKYQAINLLWSASSGRYIEPGEVIELDDEAGRILLESGNVKPAEMAVEEQEPIRRKGRKAQESEPAPEENLTGATGDLNPQASG